MCVVVFPVGSRQYGMYLVVHRSYASALCYQILKVGNKSKNSQFKRIIFISDFACNLQLSDYCAQTLEIPEENLWLTSFGQLI